MSVTIKEIARLSGVSVGTVDRVLNNRGKVKPDVDARVRAIAEAMNYHPNTVAKSLALRRNPVSVGIISHVQPSFNDYAVQRCFQGIDGALEEMKSSGITFHTEYARDFDGEHQVELINKLTDDGIEALAIAPVNTEIVRQRIMELAIPVFCFTNDIPPECPHYFVGIDNYKSGGIAAGLFHLIDPRLKKMAVICSSLSMLGNARRLQGFRDKLGEYYGGQIIQWELEAFNDNFSSYKKIDAVLNENPDIDSLFFMSGAVTGGMQAIEEAGILGKIPIITIDLAQPVKDNLQRGNIAATIDQNAYLHGYNTIRRICDFIFSGTLPEQQNLFVPSEIIIKDSL